MLDILRATRNASFVYAYEQHITTSNVYGPEDMFMLDYKLAGETIYTQTDNHIQTSPGKLVFIPKGAEFRATVLESGDYMEIKFDSPVSVEPRLQVFSGFNTREMEAAFRAVITACPERDGVGYYECQAQMNRIFAMLYRCSDSYLTSRDMNLLSPAMEYIKANVFNPSFSVKEMQSLVDVSDTYFRQLFVRCYKMSPKRYVINERVQLAKTLISDNPSIPLQYVADAIGYTDIFYFYRIFKRETGMTPGQFVREKKLDKERKGIQGRP